MSLLLRNEFQLGTTLVVAELTQTGAKERIGHDEFQVALWLNGSLYLLFTIGGYTQAIRYYELCVMKHLRHHTNTVLEEEP